MYSSIVNTVADLEYQRDVRYPYSLHLLNRREVLYTIYGMRSADHERKSKEDLFSVANSRKARYWGLVGLQDAAVMNKKKAQEKALREAVEKNPELKDLGGAWKTIQGLPPGFRVVFVLRDVEGLSTEETAESLGLSVPAVKSRLLLARLQLRERLSRYFRKNKRDGGAK